MEQQFNASNVSLDTDAVQQHEGKFCEVWVMTRLGLQMLQQMIKNPILKFIIGSLLTVGDNICKTNGNEQA